MNYGMALNSNNYNTYGSTPYRSNAFAAPNFGSSNVFQGYAQPYADNFASNTIIQTPPPKQKSFVEKHWGKMLLGAGALVAGAVLTKGKLWGKKTPATFEQAQKNLSEIFRKDIPKEEAEAMMKKYQEIYKIEDKEELAKKLFHQVKKDYGYENSNKTLKITEVPEGGILGSNSAKEISICKKQSKEEIFDTVAHEFHHMRQHEIMYRVNPEKFKEASRQNILTIFDNQEIFKKLNPSKEELEIFKLSKNEPDDFKELVERKIKTTFDFRKQEFGHLSSIKEGSAEYTKAEKYFDAQRNYLKDKAEGRYRKNLLEVEAWDIGAKMQEVVNYIGKM